MVDEFQITVNDIYIFGVTKVCIFPLNMRATIIHVARWWEKYLSKRSPLKRTCSWRNKLIVLWIRNRQAKVLLYIIHYYLFLHYLLIHILDGKTNNFQFFSLNLGKLPNYLQYFGFYNFEGVSESWVEAKMSWVEVDGAESWLKWAGWRWVHSLVIPKYIHNRQVPEMFERRLGINKKIL